MMSQTLLSGRWTLMMELRAKADLVSVGEMLRGKQKYRRLAVYPARVHYLGPT